MPDIESLEPKVDFIRGTESQISNLAITDGQFIVSEEGNIYVDIDNERVSIKENDIIAVYEKSPTTASHSVDDYIYYNNKLYRVILAIAIGDTITIGTNVELANDIEVGTKVYISGLPESTGGGVQAVDVGYDNTESGLSATNVQEAIDEISQGGDGLPSGGVTGQVLAKKTDADFDLEWVDQQGGSTSKVILTVDDELLYNKTVTYSIPNGETSTSRFSATGEAILNLKYLGTYTITSEGYTTTINNTAVGSIYTLSMHIPKSVITVTATNLNYYNSDVYMKFNGESLGTQTLSGGTTTYKVYTAGTYTLYDADTDTEMNTVSVTLDTNASIDANVSYLTFEFGTEVYGKTFLLSVGSQSGSITASAESNSYDFIVFNNNSVNYSATNEGTTIKSGSLGVGVNLTVTIDKLFPIVTWANGSDSDIVEMVAAADNGAINLSDYWSVNDERTVHLNAMSATGVGESHNAQDVIFVLSHVGGKTLTTPTASGRTTCSFQFDMKHGLYNRGYMNSTNTNVGGWTSCARRTWCNSVFKNAVPNTLSPIFKQHRNLTSAGNKSSVIDTTDDWFALRSEIEIFGTTTYSYAGEGSQVTYYQTSANRIKQSQGANYYWWERSPCSSGAAYFCFVLSDGHADLAAASSSRGLAVCGCI